MSGPRQARQRWIVTAVVGAAACVIGILPPAASNDLLPALLVSFGLTAAIVGTVGALIRHGDARHQAALLSGRERIIGRWMVDPMRWQSFVDRDRREWVPPAFLGNDLSIPRRPPQTPVEVIVGETCLQVGEDFHSFRTPRLPAIEHAGFYQGEPNVIEFGLYFPGNTEYRSRRSALRFPMGAGADAAAGAVIQHYHGLEASRYTPPLALRNPRLTWKISLALLVAALGTAGAGLLMRANGDQGDVSVGLVVGGAVAAIGVACFMALFAWIRR